MEHTRIYFIRHGETQYNVEERFVGTVDVPLNSRGMQQAEYARQALKGIEFDSIYSSPLKRAIQTAKIVMQGRKLPILHAEGLREINCGDWEGKTKEQTEALWKEEIYNWGHAPHLLRIPNGETFQKASNRAFECFRKIVEKYTGKTILMSSHMIIIQLLLLRLAEIPIRQFWEMPMLDNASISAATVDSNKGKAEITMWGNTLHIPAMERNNIIRVAGL